MSAVLEKEETIGGMPISHLEFYFDNWRKWMRRDAVTDGYPGKASGCVGGGYSQTFDDMIDAQDVRCASVTDALIWSLPPVERAALHHCYLYAVFRFPRGGYEEALHNGRLKLAWWLQARGFY